MAEPLNATFFALRRRDRAVLLPATIVFVVAFAIVVALFVALNWTFIRELPDLFRRMPGTTGAPGDQELAGRFFSGMLILFSTGLLFSIPLYMLVAAYEAACLRWMIRGEAPGVFGLTFDHDMWRVYGVYWCWLIGQIALSWAAGLLMLPIMFATMGDMMRHPDPVAMMQWQLTVQLPLMFVQYVPLIVAGLRLGPAAATSIARRRFSFFEAWKVTRDRTLALMGSYLLLWIIFGIGFVAICVATYGAVFGPLLLKMLQSTFEAWKAATTEPPEEFVRNVFSVRGLVIFALGYAVSAVWCLLYAVLSYGVNARAVLAALEDGKIEAAPAES